MIRRAGTRYRHVDSETGQHLGTHRRKADAIVVQNALKLVRDAERQGLKKKN